MDGYRVVETAFGMIYWVGNAAERGRDGREMSTRGEIEFAVRMVVGFYQIVVIRCEKQFY